MSKPTQDELAMALKAAAAMKEKNKDPYFVAKALLNANYRISYLEKVLHHAERYLKFGQEEHEHRELLRAIEHAKKEERHIEKEEDESQLGL